MKSSRTMLTLILIFMIIGPALADQALDKATTTSLVEQLTSQSRQTWIPAGTIFAKHSEVKEPETTDPTVISKEIERQLAEYRSNPWPEVAPELQKQRMEAIPFNVRYWLSNKSTMDSSVQVRYDGSRFYWEIEVESRTDTVQVPSELRGNEMTEQFRLEWNQRRVFVWDGHNYTTVTGPVDHAMVEPGVGSPGVNGPLTAGVVPWSAILPTAASVSAAQVSAASVSRDGTTQVEMVVEKKDGSSMHFMLDPAKGYAVTSCSLPSNGGTVVHNRFYSGYRQVAGNWVPASVLIEQRDAFTNRLLRSDKWDFTIVDAVVPGPEAFSVAYHAGTVVEYVSPVSGVATFNYSNVTDTEALKAERLAYAATESKQPQNCATAALKHAAARLGKSVSDSVLARLVGADGRTTLYDLKQAAQGLGLHCRAVATDIATLKDLPDCAVILHLPGQGHFVVLDHVDDRYAWIVDLSSNRFFYPRSVDLLPLEWPEGTALLLSTRPIKGKFRDLSASALGAAGGADPAGWSCTKLLQEDYYILCTPTAEGCTGYFRGYFLRYGCEPAASGTCTEESYWRLVVSPCYSDPVQDCVLGEPMFYFIKACS